MKLAALILMLWVAAIIALSNHGVIRTFDLLRGIPTIVRG